MFNRERLFAIKELNIANRLLHMRSQRLEEYVQELNHFIDGFPQHEAGIRGTLERKDAKSLTEKTLALREELLKIGADDIAAECWKYVNNFNSEQFGRFAAYVNFLLSQLAALSIDIQMALFKGDAEQPAEAAAEKHAEKLILAVDDDPQCLDLFKLALREVPCKIIALTSGQAALGIVKTHKPDLFVLDIDMPQMNGLELAKQIAATGCKAPIIFITGNAQKSVVVQALQAGAKDFILKPISPQYVVERVKRFI